MATTTDSFSTRKAQHLEICLDNEKYRVETTKSDFSEVKFLHRSLPEIHADQVDISTEVLGFKASAPVFISCMTGGSAEGYKLNKDLATAAERLGIPVGMGSNRILWKKPETLPHFQFRKFAPSVPILSNIGAIQVRDMGSQTLIEMNKRLEVSAQVVHLNPGQELFQPEGDRDFRDIKEALFRFIEQSPIPVIVKETGFGLHPMEVQELSDAGAYAVDLAGSGGTNWIAVEASRSRKTELKRSREFDDWGYSTALLLAVLQDQNLPIWASGGIRSGMDVAKSLAMSAKMVGMAMPFAKAASEGGIEGILAFFDSIIHSLKDVMALTSSKNLQELSQVKLLFSRDFTHQRNELKGL